MAGIPTNFQAISNVLPTYNYIDIAAGTGIINFYAGKTVDLNLLSNSTFYSDVVLTTSTVLNAGYQKVIDLDFDVLLNRPLNLAGSVVLNVPISVYTNTSPNTLSAYIIAKVRKWDGVTETDICENQSSTFSQLNPGTSPGTFRMLAIDLTIPLTHFKIGEYLRLTIEGWAKDTAASGNSYLNLGHDPMNRTVTWDTTGAVPSRLTFQVPTRLDL